MTNAWLRGALALTALAVAGVAVAQAAPPGAEGPAAATAEQRFEREQPGRTARLPAPGLAPATPPVSGCELHVWPGVDLRSRSTGWLSAFGLVGTIADAAVHADDDRARRAELGAALDSAGQARALAALDLPRDLGLDGYRTVMHDGPIAPTAVRVRTRHAGSDSPCYAELLVTRLLYRGSAMQGRELRVAFLFREFGDAAAPRWTRSGEGAGRLTLFPPRDPAQAELGRAELVLAYQIALDGFARRLTVERARREVRAED